MSTGLDLRETGGGTRLRLRVKPSARKNAILGAHAGALKIAVAAPPEGGRANEAVLDLLSEALAVPRSSLTLAAGSLSRDKTVLVALAAAVVEARLGGHLGRRNVVRDS